MTEARRTPNRATSTRPERSSRKVAHKKPLGWLPWAAAGSLALLSGLVFLGINAIDDDGPAGPAGDSLGQVSGSGGSGINGDDQAAGALPGAGTSVTPTDLPGASASALPSAAPSSLPSATPSASTSVSLAPPASASVPAASPSTPAPAAGSRAGSGSGSGADLKVGSQDLLALSAGSLAGTASTAVTGSAPVQSVVSDEGFWVGNSTTNRVFVYLTPQARASNGESGFQVRAGQSVQLAGQLTKAAAAPQALRGVTPGEGLAQLREQGSYVAADRVTLAG